MTKLSQTSIEASTADNRTNHLTPWITSVRTYPRTTSPRSQYSVESLHQRNSKTCQPSSVTLIAPRSDAGIPPLITQPLKETLKRTLHRKPRRSYWTMNAAGNLSEKPRTNRTNLSLICSPRSSPSSCSISKRIWSCTTVGQSTLRCVSNFQVYARRIQRSRTRMQNWLNS